ncbi:MAG: cyclic nucleotide-binding domain-containing protein [Chloroflexi bacterium]|nr:cyclic nucleotide-binding domain-containing protein [Chloroflexota bacterium]MCL5276115.1 cyclic nucleotide-binding domain-containing protein [Chloroflexota bacterium]
MLENQPASDSKSSPMALKLDHGSRVAVIGGGPAGTFFTIFLLDMAERAGVDIQVDIYEPREFSMPGPGGCNMCGGIISESLVQNLATEGINLPPTIVQRGIDSYCLHMDIGNVRIETPLMEKRIAAVHRGSGPRDIKQVKWGSFDGYLLELAIGKGARVIHKRVNDVSWQDGRPSVSVREDGLKSYDLLGVATGVNTSALKLFQALLPEYQPPETTKTFIRDYYIGVDTINEYLGSSMHVFLLNIPRLEFAAIIPKGEYVTVCLLGEDIDAPLIQAFLASSEVQSCMPPGWSFDQMACQCSPRINVQGTPQPFADRIVFIGDCGVTRLYKDGIGAAYRTAKTAASTAVLHGVSAEDFRRHYLPICRSIGSDNAIGKIIFAFARQAQKVRLARRAILNMASGEQGNRPGAVRRMSTILWDLFTGSAPYQDILMRAIHPAFLVRLAWHIVNPLRLLHQKEQRMERAKDKPGALGRIFKDGEVIVRQGEVGHCMYVIQEGQVEIIGERAGKEVVMATRKKDDFFGEMAIFERDVRSATVRARGEVRVLTVERENLLRRIHEDPSLAFRMVETMSHRLRELNAELVRLKSNKADS